MFEKYLHDNSFLAKDVRDVEKIIKDAINNPNEAFVRALIKENGLGDLLPYIDDPKQILANGSEWQKLRGTLRAIEIGLSWLNIPKFQLITNGPGIHFAEYEIHLEAKPLPEEIKKIIGVCDLSASARDRLTRLFHPDNDTRQLELSGPRDRYLGNAMLSDVSGKIIHGIKISF
jgi:hypothetical protein